MINDITLPIIVKKDDNDTFMAYCPIFKWFHTFAENKEDLPKYLEEVMWMYFEMYNEEEKGIFNWDKTLFLNFNKNGKITSDFNKEFDKDPSKILMKTT